MGNKIILIGLGNPILGDDGVGWKVIEYIQKYCSLPIDVDVDCLALGGISLMERLIGYDQAILVDAIVTKQHPIGSVSCLNFHDLPDLVAGHLSSTHDTTLQVALQLGLSMGASLPRQIMVVAVEAQNVYDFSEDLTPPIAAAVPKAAQSVIDILTESKIAMH